MATITGEQILNFITNDMLDYDDSFDDIIAILSQRSRKLNLRTTIWENILDKYENVLDKYDNIEVMIYDLSSEHTIQNFIKDNNFENSIKIEDIPEWSEYMNELESSIKHFQMFKIVILDITKVDNVLEFHMIFMDHFEKRYLKTFELIKLTEQVFMLNPEDKIKLTV